MASSKKNVMVLSVLVLLSSNVKAGQQNSTKPTRVRTNSAERRKTEMENAIRLWSQKEKRARGVVSPKPAGNQYPI